jgi:hypothetical protein
MPKSQQQNLDQMVASVVARLAAGVASAVEQQVAERLRTRLPALTRGAPAARAAKAGKAGRRGVRLCPVPGCGEPGAGPRNRWFCSEHAGSLPVKEQKRLLAASKASALALPAGKGKAAKGGRKARGNGMDMSCRVEGCPNRSRGPRFGFICDEHREKLSADEQQKARDAYKLKQKK